MNERENSLQGKSEKSSGDQSDDLTSAQARALARLMELAREKLPPGEVAGASSAAFARFNRAHAAASSARGDAHWGMARSDGRAARFARVMVLSVGAAVLVGGGGLAIWRGQASRPLVVTVVRGALDEGGFVHAAGTSAPGLRFSDGTEVDLAPSSRARVADTTRHGARVLLDHGRVAARVVPRPSSRWFFDAGPCRVLVTGTHFDMTWSAPEQILEVMLYSGSVTVKGPPATGGVPMRAGQHLVMDVRQGSVRLSDLAAPAPSPSPSPSPADAAERPATLASHQEATAVESPAAPLFVARTVPGDHAPGREHWADRVLSGRFRTVIAEAEKRGVDKVLARESAENIVALADAARYAGAYGLAHRSLLAVRRRFPDTAPAQRAAFLLGRLAEDQRGNLTKALAWYDTYLAGNTDETFRAEAMGRQMTATLNLGRSEEARTLAGRYLQRYPQGAYARAAQGILSR